jgi:enoyl-CoA hydratase
MMTREDRGDVAVLRLEHGKANALSPELLRALVTEVEDLSRGAKALVLTGSGQMFSAGLDLPVLMDAGPGYTYELMDALDESLEMMIDLPVPAVAAINGHAIAGGFILAAACDARLMATGGGKVGLTELLVGVPFPPLALEIVRTAVGDRCARRMVLHGELFAASEAENLGLVDELATPATLMDRATELANRLGDLPKPAFQITKRQLLAPLRMRLEHLGGRQEQLARQVWVAEETMQLMQRFVRERLG